MANGGVQLKKTKYERLERTIYKYEGNTKTKTL